MGNIISNGDFSSYIRYVNNIPMLSQEEEVSLAEELANGSTKAGQKLVLSHLRLVVKIAFSYKNYGASIQDLVSEGNLGLMHAVKKFKSDMGYRLSTYASWWIRSAIQEFIIKTWSLLKINSTSLKEKLFCNSRATRAKVLSMLEGGADIEGNYVMDSSHDRNESSKARKANIKVISNELTLIDENLEKIKSLPSQDKKARDKDETGDENGACMVDESPMVSLERSVSSLGNLLSVKNRKDASEEYIREQEINTRYLLPIEPDSKCESPAAFNVRDKDSINQEEFIETKEENKEKSMLLKKALLALNDREKEVVMKRQIENVTLKSLALCLGVSAERVRQIEQSAMRKLRNVCQKD